jgi:hypothetical protein
MVSLYRQMRVPERSVRAAGIEESAALNPGATRRREV